MARATVAEIDKRLSAHEAACEVRWRENWRRLETIETEVKAINKSIPPTIKAVLMFPTIKAAPIAKVNVAITGIPR